MAKWFVAAKRADFNRIGKEFGISPVLARIIRNRDIVEEADIRKYLEGTVEELYDPFLMKDMDKAVGLIAGKIASHCSIRVIGDYDVDGICSAYILLHGLQELGAAADTVIPHRMKDGYGLNDNLIEEALAAGVDTIITCDNGIAAAPQIELGKQAGMTIIVTDHHEVPFEETGEGHRQVLPPADAVVDPKRDDCNYPFKQICGGMVAYKLVEALHVKMGKVIDPELQEELRCLAAFATICDVMELKDENRILVKYGLQRLNHTSNLGLRALIEVSGLQEPVLSPYHIGFILGPCLNATGRLDTAERALSLLGCKEYREAVVIAKDLKSLNESRKEMTLRSMEEAVALVETTEIKKDKVLVLFLPDCHESLAGIIAGRIRERYGKPAFVLTRGEEEVKGSGRSIDAYHMYQEMCKCRDLFTRFGGHKLAAGLSLSENNVEIFRKALNENASLTEEDFEEVLHIDIPMPLSYASREFIRELDRLEPFGMGNPKPVFAQKDIRLLKGTIMGKNKNVGKYTIADGEGRRYEMIYFGNLERFNHFLSERYSGEMVDYLYKGESREEMNISIAYYPDINSYMGRESIQIVMQNYC